MSAGPTSGEHAARGAEDGREASSGAGGAPHGAAGSGGGGADEGSAPSGAAGGDGVGVHGGHAPSGEDGGDGVGVHEEDAPSCEDGGDGVGPYGGTAPSVAACGCGAGADEGVTPSAAAGCDGVGEDEGGARSVAAGGDGVGAYGGYAPSVAVGGDGMREDGGRAASGAVDCDGYGANGGGAAHDGVGRASRTAEMSGEALHDVEDDQHGGAHGNDAARGDGAPRGAANRVGADPPRRPISITFKRSVIEDTIGAMDEMVELTRRPATTPPGRKRTSHAVDDVNTESDDAPDPFEYKYSSITSEVRSFYEDKKVWSRAEPLVKRGKNCKPRQFDSVRLRALQTYAVTACPGGCSLSQQEALFDLPHISSPTNVARRQGFHASTDDTTTVRPHRLVRDNRRRIYG